METAFRCLSTEHKFSTKAAYRRDSRLVWQGLCRQRSILRQRWLNSV